MFFSDNACTHNSGGMSKMALTEKGCKERLIDVKINRNKRLFGALSIEGPKWCGKTWTSLNHVNSVVYLLDPENQYANRESARLNPSVILTGDKPLLVDEWQEVPAVWDAVRFACDRTSDKGLYFLTGSVTPRKDSFVHSGAGRIGRIRMRTMTLIESGDSTGDVSLFDLFNEKQYKPGMSMLTQEKLVNLMVRGGWPENIDVQSEDAGVLPQQYLATLAETDISSVDNIKRKPDVVLHLLASIARTNATTTLQTTIVSDLQARYDSITRQTVAEYMSALSRVYVIEEIPQWFPELRDKLRLRNAPKRMLTDPSIAVSALKAFPNDLKRDPRTMGGIFEAMCLRDLLVYSEILDAKLSHYHDSNGLEVDAILELGSKWAAIEIKMGTHNVEDGVKTLKKLRCKIISKGASSPAFLCVITGGGPLYTREDGIHVIPIDCLKP
jgi:predicted AAA+ superfamily ATPase